MGVLHTNPENGRRSGDVFSVPVASGIAVQKGDLLVVKDGYGVPVGTTGSALTDFLGVADESKETSGEREIIALTKGVFPFNKTAGAAIAFGAPLTATDNNTLKTAGGSDAVIATAFYAASADATIVYAKINSKR